MIFSVLFISHEKLHLSLNSDFLSTSRRESSTSLSHSEYIGWCSLVEKLPLFIKNWIHWFPKSALISRNIARVDTKEWNSFCVTLQFKIVKSRKNEGTSLFVGPTSRYEMHEFHFWVMTHVWIWIFITSCNYPPILVNDRTVRDRDRVRPNLVVRWGSAEPPNHKVRSTEPPPNQITRKIIVFSAFF